MDGFLHGDLPRLQVRQGERLGRFGAFRVPGSKLTAGPRLALTCRDFLFAGAQPDEGKQAPQNLDFQEGTIEVKVSRRSQGRSAVHYLAWPN